MQRFAGTLAAVIGAALGACYTLSGGAVPPDDIPFVPGQGSAEKLTDGEREVARQAIAALAAELQISEDQIQVDTIRAVNWPDSSIGCPQPGRAYLDVISPGHKVTLRAKGQVHVVHEAKNRAFVCQRTKALGGLTPERELAFGKQMMAARDDLAKRLRVSPDEIRPVSAMRQTWTDASLGCPEPGVSNPPSRVDGWVLTFQHGVRDYTYHTDMTRTIPCPAITTD